MPSRSASRMAGLSGILDARVQQEYPLVDVHVGRAHLEDAVESVAVR